ncbi:MAG: tRNA (adenosine(37)-N6)-dimethylallyltransferase MiaA [SAR324 cluster bacterium]|nr:tRNA (adenosine(37)-N6)-dimethylallyltransferase MiaA [SAR324 cluster bacterium]MBL7034313.1 tRNA (adenosine(37)-N6)-dimethylallyltransferase MiaA [SAR324 cluster bacterium]
MQTDQKIIVVAGPTASGKSDLAMNLAQEFNGELICSDSMQVYRKMDIGTAKPTLAEQKLVPYHQLDLIDPDGHYSAGQYERDTSLIIKQIQERGHLPILVGGTGLYYRALMYGISNIPDIPESLREEILGWQTEHGTSYCWNQLQKHDPEGAARLHPNDTARILRSLEVVLATGRTLTSFQQQQPFSKARYEFQAVALEWERSRLYERINQRTRSMLDSGWIAEVEMLLTQYPPKLKPLQAIGYREIVQYLHAELEWEPMVQRIQQRTRQYAKRQMTWFKKEDQVEWYRPDVEASILTQIKSFLSR